MTEAPEKIYAIPYRSNSDAGRWFRTTLGDSADVPYIRADLYARALSAAKEAAGELEALHKARGGSESSFDILKMVKAEIAELEK